jgi:hypothetical protein
VGTLPGPRILFGKISGQKIKRSGKKKNVSEVSAARRAGCWLVRARVGYIAFLLWTFFSASCSIHTWSRYLAPWLGFLLNTSNSSRSIELDTSTRPQVHLMWDFISTCDFDQIPRFCNFRFEDVWINERWKEKMKLIFLYLTKSLRRYLRSSQGKHFQPEFHEFLEISCLPVGSQKYLLAKIVF